MRLAVIVFDGGIRRNWHRASGYYGKNRIEDGEISENPHVDRVLDSFYSYMVISKEVVESIGEKRRGEGILSGGSGE